MSRKRGLWLFVALAFFLLPIVLPGLAHARIGGGRDKLGRSELADSLANYGYQTTDALVDSFTAYGLTATEKASQDTHDIKVITVKGGTTVRIVLTDAGGSSEFQIADSDGSTAFSVNSDGEVSFSLLTTSQTDGNRFWWAGNSVTVVADSTTEGRFAYRSDEDVIYVSVGSRWAGFRPLSPVLCNTILDPEVAADTSGTANIPLFTFMSESYPIGFVVTDIEIATNATCTDSMAIVRMTNNGTAVSVADTTEQFYALSGTLTPDDGTIDNPAYNADDIMALAYTDSAPTDLIWLTATVRGHMEEQGD
jgi:hypothetical protein